MYCTYIIFIFPTICRVGVIQILQMMWDLVQAEWLAKVTPLVSGDLWLETVFNSRDCATFTSENVKQREVPSLLTCPGVSPCWSLTGSPPQLHSNTAPGQSRCQRRGSDWGPLTVSLAFLCDPAPEDDLPSIPSTWSMASRSRMGVTIVEFSPVFRGEKQP